MPWTLQWKEELGGLDLLLALLVESPHSAESEIAHEHVQSARRSILGAMPAECEFDLKLARTAVAHIKDMHMRNAAQKILRGLPSARGS